MNDHVIPRCIFVSRRYLRETLKIANAAESHRLTACALILLGHAFLKHGNVKVWILRNVRGMGANLIYWMKDMYAMYSPLTKVWRVSFNLTREITRSKRYP